MNLLNIIFISIGLAMDAFSVSITNGVTIKKMKKRYALKIALFFGGFQALMPIIGWFAGSAFKKHIESVDHWIAFVLLTFIGGKMIYESTIMEENEESKNPLDAFILLTLAIATSIDALAVGITLSVLKVNILNPAIIIGIITFIFCFAGVFIGNKFGSLFEDKIEIFGGVVLIIIGLKILVEHLYNFSLF